MKRILAIASLILFSAAAFAQTGISFTTGTDAVMVYKGGNLGAPDLSYIETPVWNSSADNSGTVNSVNFRVDAFVPDSSMGFTYYGAGAAFTPTKWFNAALKKIANQVPPDSLRLEFDGTVGSYTPSVGNSRISGLVGPKLSYAITSSGTVTWDVAQAGTNFEGGWYYATGFKFSSASASTQSTKLSKLRRALRLKSVSQGVE